MYRSTLLIDTGTNPDRPRPGRQWLRNRYHVHQRLCMAFPSSTQREIDEQFLQPFDPDGFERGRDVHGQRTGEQAFLFRVDPHPNGRAVIVVQSAKEPDWDYAFQNTPFLVAKQVENFDPLFAPGVEFRFRLLANPTRKICTKSTPDGKKNNGKRVPVKTDQLIEWFVRKSSGFSIGLDSTDIQTGYINVSNPRDGKARLFAVQYDGVLKITDAEQFENVLISGIGPAKSFGFGLLSITPVPRG